MKHDPYPDVSDELKAHALAITVGRYRTTAALLSRFSLGDWLAILAVFIDYEVARMVERDKEALPEIARITDGPILASQLIARWKGDASIRKRFGSFIDYTAAVEGVLSGDQPFDTTLLP